MRRISIYLIALLSLFCAHADVPAGYYHSLVGKTGQDLKDAVHALTKNHTKLSYNSLWYYYYETDYMPNNRNQVWDMYSNNQYFFGSQGTAVSGMNKEHSFPKSWWGGSSSRDAYSDLYHVIPADASANSARGNLPFGDVATSDWDNGSAKRGTPRSGQGGGSSKVFEPDDEYKGDFARIYFYVVSCYQDYNWATTTMLTNDDWRTLNTWSIELLLRWARQDPVSEKERNRNDAVQKYQNNRNPFVDNPDLMEYIWGNKVGTGFVEGGEDPGPGPGPGPDPQPTDVATLISPTQGTILEFGDVAVGDSATLTLYVRGEHFTSPLTLKCYLNQYTMFSLSTTSIDTTSLNSLEGYPLEVTYKPTSLGEHKAKILFSGGGMATSVGIQLRATGVETSLEPIVGDVNGDGQVDISDVNAVINAMLGKTSITPDPSPEGEGRYDVNGDDVVDISDVNMVINLMLGK